MGGGVRDKQPFVRWGAILQLFWSFAVFPAGKMEAFATKAKLLSKRQLATFLVNKIRTCLSDSSILLFQSFDKRLEILNDF